VAELTAASSLRRPLDFAAFADRRVAAYLLAAVSVTALGAVNGGYYPGAWGWGALGFFWVGGIALAFELRVGRLAVVFASFGVALLAWTILSGFWSSDLTATGLTAQRQLLYAAAVISALIVVRRSSVAALLAGVWTGTVLICGYGLLTRLLPDHLGVIDPIAGYRLSGSIGYWNSFGLLAALGTLLALGFVARAESTALRIAAAASLPVLVPALYYTYSRGAWLSLAIAFVFLVAVDPARLQLLLATAVTGWAAALAVVLAAARRPLTTLGYPLAAEAHAGHRVLIEIALLACAAAACAGLLLVSERRVVVPERLRVVVGGAVWLFIVVGAVAFTVRFGAPWTATINGWRTFAHRSSSGGSSSLNGRLLSFYGSGRVTQWDVAWKQFEAHPWLGGGAGTWADYWVTHRPVASTIHNVHNQYLEALSELGPAGLALTLGFIGVPLAAFVRVRRSPYASAAAAALVAFAVHSIVDWDWQLAGVTVPALLCGVALVAYSDAVSLPRLAAPVAIGAVALLLLVSVWTAIGRMELGRISSDARAGRWVAAEHEARRASTLEPWSAEAWGRLGSLAASGGDRSLAQTAYQRAVARDGANWELWLGLAQVSSGAVARRALAHAHALNPLEVSG
jgi:hypothetical protein